MDKCESLFEKHNIKPVVGVIPNNKDKELLSYPKRENFWNIVNKWKKKTGKSQCTGTLIFTTRTQIKKIILIMVVAQNFLVIQLKIKLKN